MRILGAVHFKYTEMRSVYLEIHERPGVDYLVVSIFLSPFLMATQQLAIRQPIPMYVNRKHLHFCRKNL